MNKNCLKDHIRTASRLRDEDPTGAAVVYAFGAIAVALVLTATFVIWCYH